jgi:hypothetical protein
MNKILKKKKLNEPGVPEKSVEKSKESFKSGVEDGRKFFEVTKNYPNGAENVSFDEMKKVINGLISNLPNMLKK